MSDMKKRLGIYTKRDDYYVTVTMCRSGQIYNHLEDCYYDLDDERCFVIEGTLKEKWPVTFETLQKTYLLDDETKEKLFSGSSAKVSPKKTEDKLICFEVLKEMTVTTSYGDKLKAHVGDIIACKTDEQGKYDDSHARVINKEVFRNTYKKV